MTRYSRPMPDQERDAEFTRRVDQLVAEGLTRAAAEKAVANAMRYEGDLLPRRSAKPAA